MRKEEEKMPFIDSKISVPVSAEQKEELKSDLGKLIATLHKSETYLMVGIEDNYDLWLGGRKLEKGAYISVSLFGNAPRDAYDKLTGQLCELCDIGRACGIKRPAPQQLSGLYKTPGGRHAAEVAGISEFFEFNQSAEHISSERIRAVR